MNRHRWIASGAALLLLALAASFGLRRSDAPQAAAAEPGIVNNAVSNTNAQARPAFAAPPGASTARPDSLRGTDVDGAVHLDAQGRAIADRDLRRLFDYFLARLGERTVTQVREDLRAYVSPRAPAAAAAQILAWFDAYVDVEQAHAGMRPSGDPQADFEQLRRSRRDRYGAELAEAWFGDEERYTEATWARLAVQRDATLEAQERARRLAAIDADLPPQLAAERADSVDFHTAVAQTESLNGASDDAATRFRERAEVWGETAAARLAELDRSEVDWTRRLHEFAQQRRALENLDAAQREVQLQAWLVAHFAPAEQRRVLALADAGLLPAP